MSLPHVGQAQMLADKLEQLVKQFSPPSIGLIGCAGGNGLDRLTPDQLERVVALDINPSYIGTVGLRHAHRLSKLELYRVDVQSASFQIEPVDLIFAALLFEYVDVAATLAALKRHCRPGGTLATVVQLPHRDRGAISPSPYESLNLLAPVIKLIAPADLCALATAAGFLVVDSEMIELASGKQFSLQVFQALTDDGMAAEQA